MSLYGQAPYDGYSGYGGFATDPGAPVRPYYNAGVGSYDPAVSQNYYQQNSVNTAYRGYRAPDSTMTAAQWGTPLAAAGIYAMTGMHKVFGAKGRLAAGWAARAAYASVGLSTKGGAFSTGARGYMRGGEAMLRNSFRRAGSFITGKAYAPVAEEAISVARTGSLGVGAARAIGGFAGEWIGGPLEAAWLGAKAANEGVFKPYAYSRAIANQALMQNSGVPYYGAGMGSVYTSTGLGSRGAASYGNAVEKYGMSNMFYSQQNAGHLAGLMQQAGLLSDKSTMPQLKSATVKALKDIRSILDVASVSGSEAIKMLSTYKQGGMSVSEGTRAIKKLAQYGALSGLGIKQLVDQSAKPAMEQGASLGLIPGYAGQYGARVTANFESYYHRGLLRNSAYGVLGGPAGAQQLALGGLSAYANSPLGQVGLYNDYMARTGNAGDNMAGMMANFGSRFAQNPMNQEGLMQLNEPYMQSQLLKSKNRGKALRMTESFLGQINPEEITKKGASAGALEGILTSTEGFSTEQARRLIYEQIAKQKAAGNSADLAAKLQQDLRQMEMHEEHTGETWGGVPRFVEKNIYRAGTFTSGAARGVSSGWAGILHGFHEGLFDLEYGKTAYNMSRSARDMKDVETHKDQLKRALAKGSKFNGVVTGIKRQGGFLNNLQEQYSDMPGFDGWLLAKGVGLFTGEANSTRRFLLDQKGAEAHNAGLIEQEIASGHFSEAQSGLKAMGRSVSIPTLKEMRPMMNETYTHSNRKIQTFKWGEKLSDDGGSSEQAKYDRAIIAYHKDPNSINWNRIQSLENRIKHIRNIKLGKKMSIADYAAQSVGLPADATGVKAYKNLDKSLENLKGYKTFNDHQLIDAGTYFSGINGKTVGLSAKALTTLTKDTKALKDAKTPSQKYIARNNLVTQIEKDSKNKIVKKFEDRSELTKKATKDLKEIQHKVNAKGVMQTMNLQGPVTMHAHNVTVVTGSGGSGGSGGGSPVKAQTSWFSSALHGSL